MSSSSRPKTLAIARLRSHTATIPPEVAVTTLFSSILKVAGSTLLIRLLPAGLPSDLAGYNAITPLTTPSSSSFVPSPPTASTTRLPSSQPAAMTFPPFKKHSPFTLPPNLTSSNGKSPSMPFTSYTLTASPAQYPHLDPSGPHRTSSASILPSMRCTNTSFALVRSHRRMDPSIRPSLPRAQLSAAEPLGCAATAATGPACPPSTTLSSATRWVLASSRSIFPSSVPRQRWVDLVDGGGGQTHTPALGMKEEEGGRHSPISRRAGREYT
mmetsp:Transcript_4908/g.9761  ORF Transcript_4908/g.9761 Transcript_4908/m.9761 type:complete len:270 (-) Transcript_4908:766-1575(-)